MKIFLDVFKALSPSILVTIIAILVAFHYDSVSDLRSDYNEKLNAIEREKDDAINERDLYFNYLVYVPGSLVQLQKEISTEKQKNFELEQKLADLPELADKPYFNNGYIRKGSTFKDDFTKLTVGLLDVYRDASDITQAKIKVSLPTGEESVLEVVAGDSYNYDVDDTNYWFVVTETNWYGNSVSISITEQTPENVRKIILVKKKYLFAPETR